MNVRDLCRASIVKLQNSWSNVARMWIVLSTMNPHWTMRFEKEIWIWSRFLSPTELMWIKDHGCPEALLCNMLAVYEMQFFSLSCFFFFDLIFDEFNLWIYFDFWFEFVSLIWFDIFEFFFDPIRIFFCESYFESHTIFGRWGFLTSPSTWLKKARTCRFATVMEKHRFPLSL